MPTKPNQTPPTQAVKPQLTEEEFVAKYQAKIKEVFNQHYKELVSALATETNIANRYDYKIKIDELLYVYKLILGE